MKEKIMYLILGILIGAVITAGCFLVFAKGAKQPMDGKMGERLDFENMTEEEMMEKRGNQDFNGENRKRPTNDVESEPNTQDTSTTSDTNSSTQNS